MPYVFEMFIPAQALTLKFQESEWMELVNVMNETGSAYTLRYDPDGV